MSDYDIHSCGYYCDRHACILRQRDELRDKLFSDQAVKTYSGGKPNYTQPEEPTIDGWPLWSGLPPSIPAIKVQDKSFEEFAQSFAQSAQVIGIPEPEPVAYINVEERNLSWAKPTRWETPTVAKMDKVPLYAAPPKREWHELTDNEIAAIKNKYGFGVNIFSFMSAVRELETWLKERNSTSERNVQTSDNKSAESSQP
jgi:hypothetical protein